MNRIQNPSRRSAAEIAQAILFRGRGAALCRDGLTPPAFFDLLIKEEQYNDAIRFLSHALPKRLAVWWGCLCLWQVSRPEADVKTAAALAAACHWVVEPSEAHRRAAEVPGRAAGYDTSAGCLAMAVYWSGGSMAPSNLPPIPPPPLLTQQMLAGAILLAAATSGLAPVRTLRRREFLAVGREVAAGNALWFDPESARVSEPAPDLREPALVGESA